MSANILPWHDDLGRSEDDVTTVADDLDADLDQLIAQVGQRPRLRRVGQSRILIIELVDQYLISPDHYIAVPQVASLGALEH
jgi:hypothetical protein